jgi:hypothetical protein
MWNVEYGIRNAEYGMGVWAFAKCLVVGGDAYRDLYLLCGQKPPKAAKTPLTAPSLWSKNPAEGGKNPTNLPSSAVKKTRRRRQKPY